MIRTKERHHEYIQSVQVNRDEAPVVALIWVSTGELAPVV